MTKIDHDKSFRLNIDRDESWLEFNKRVLAQATDSETPLLEKAHFLAICSSNLDEFFMKRVGRLFKKIQSETPKLEIDKSKLISQLENNRITIKKIVDKQSRILEMDLLPSLESIGIQFVKWTDLSSNDRSEITKWYLNKIHPILTPITVDPEQPFPHISNLAMNLGVIATNNNGQDSFFCRIKIPPKLPQLIRINVTQSASSITLKNPLKYISLTELVNAHLNLLLPGALIKESLLFRITRAAGVDDDNDDDINSLIEFVEESLEHRKFADPVRLECEKPTSSSIIKILKNGLNITDSMIYEKKDPIDHSCLYELKKLSLQEHKYPNWEPVTPSRLQSKTEDIFTIIDKKDLLVHHPYESFRASTIRFIYEAAHDLNVLAIKLTIYRTQLESSLIDNLIYAAKSGKQVFCLVEIRARFDEDKNLKLIHKLEKNGIHVSYGTIGLKTHVKCALVVRRNNKGLNRCYAHIGTGNYHPAISKIYSDIGLFTSNNLLTEEINQLFNAMMSNSIGANYNLLVVAPNNMRQKFFSLIDNEITNAKFGKPSRIIAKMNQLEDDEIITKLKEASSAGVQIQLLVRGFCCLRPGVKNLTENISVQSTIGRFLEHSRIYYFANASIEPIRGNWFIGSADWMKRSFDKRIELIVPVVDNSAKDKLFEILNIYLDDKKNSWDLNPNGKYTRSTMLSNCTKVGAFETFCSNAIQSSNKMEF